jgi:predicted dehydrogenase
MSCAIEERRMYFSGTEGSLIADLFECNIRAKRLGYDEPTRVYRLPGVMHGGGDQRIAESLVESMAAGAAPACSGEEGLTSAVVSLGIEQSRLEGRMVDLEPTWSRLGR